MRDFFKPKTVKKSIGDDDSGFKRSNKVLVTKRSIDDLEEDVIVEAFKVADTLAQPHMTLSQPVEHIKLSDDNEPKSSPAKKKSNYNAFIKKKQSGPSAPGTKPLPTGALNCLLGLTFVFTGELSSISRDNILDIVKGLGGRVTTAPSRKTDYVVVGEDPGESKLGKVKELGLKTLDEDELFELIRTRPSSTEAECVTTAKVITSSTTSSTKKTVFTSAKAEISIHADAVIQTKQLKNQGNDLWTARYAPHSESELIGNHSIYDKLLDWLKDYSSKKEQSKAALLSGPPGIGKTTMAHLAARAAGFEILEFNASDTRNKKNLHENIKEIINNTSLSFFQTPQSSSVNKLKKQVIIMDEVDGMSSGDRGGMAELILLIKKTRIPIICCCNDRSSPKVRSLANYCLDLRFRRPDARQVSPRINEICTQEGLKLAPNVIEELVTSTHGDIRQLLNILSTFKLSGSSAISYEQSKQIDKKDLEEGPFDVVYKLLGGQYDKMRISERLDAYFVDSSLVPLMIHENYLKARAFTKRPTLTAADPSFLELASKAADCFSSSEKIESLIRGSNQEWSLAPLHGFMTSVLPSYYVHGSISGQIGFPTWFGANSKAGKTSRLLREISHHSYPTLRASPMDIRLYYGESLIDIILDYLQKNDPEGAVTFMDRACLCREDVDSLIDICDRSSIWSQIPSASKAAFTRKYNAHTHKLPYAQSSSGKVIKVQDLDAGNEEELGDEDVAEEQEEDSLSNDKMIKQTTAKGKKKK